MRLRKKSLQTENHRRNETDDVPAGMTVAAYNAHLASFPELNTNPVLEVDRAGNVKYQNSASKATFPNLPELKSEHPFLADWNTVIKKLYSGNLLKPLIREIKVGRFFYEQSIVAVAEDEIRIYVRDTTKHRHAEAALRLSENNFRNSMDSSPLGIRIVNQDSKTVYFNQAFLDIYGYASIEEFDAVPAEKRYTPESYAGYQDWVKKRNSGLPIPANYDISILRKDGTEHRVLVTRKTLIWGGKRAFQTLYNDITERYQLMQQINELSAVQRLVTDINQLIVKMDDESELLQQACDRFVENRKYPLTWVGFIQSGSYQVLPVAQAGKDADYLNSAKITWDDSKFGSGPTGTAIKTGKFSMLTNIPTSPEYQPWQKEASKNGFMSSLALPLFVRGKVIGALNIYSNSANAFDQKEILLLEEMAGDLSLGIEKIRQRKEHERLETVQREHEKRLREAQEMAHLGFWDWNLKTDAVTWSPEVFRIFRLDPAVFKPDIHSILDLSPWSEDHRRDQELINKAAQSHNTGTYEQKFLRPDGSIGYYLSNYRGVYDPDGKLVSIAGTVLDITELKQAEEALKASEENFHNSIAGAPIGIYITSPDWQPIYANQAFLDIFGYQNFNEIMDAPPHTFYTESSHAKLLERRLEKGKGSGVLNELEVEIKRKDGTTRNLQIFRKGIIWDGKPQYQLFYNDITERKKAEASLKVSDEKYATLIEQSTDGILIIRNRVIEFANPQMSKMTGYPQQEIIGKYFYDLASPEYKEMLEQIYIRRRSGLEESVNHRMELRTSSGGKVSVETKIQGIMYLGANADMLMVHDITERKQAEAALIASEENFRNSIDHSPIGVRIVDSQWHTLYCNKVFLDIHGYATAAEMDSVKPVDMFPPAEYKLFLERRAKVLNGEPEPDRLELDVIRKNGELRHIKVSRTEVLWNGQPQYQVLYTDITESKNTEAALKASEENFRTSIDNSPMGVRIVDSKWHTLYANKVFMDIFGYKNMEEVTASPLEDHYTPEEKIRANIRKQRIAQGEPMQPDIEVDIIRKDGEIRHLQVFLKETRWNGKPQRQVTYNDITERKQAEDACKLSEQNFRNSMDNSLVGIRISDQNDANLYANQAMLDIFGYRTIADIQAHPPQEFYTPDAHAAWELRHERFLRGEPMPKQLEINIIRQDGKVRNLQVSMKDVFWDGKSRYQTLYSDITELKQAEEERHESEAKYKMIVENTHDMIFTVNEREELVYISPSFTANLGYSQEDINGKAFISLVHPGDRPLIVRETLRTYQPGYKSSPESEYRIKTRNGDWRWIISRGNRVKDINGNFLYFIGVARDVTDQKRAEEEKKRLEEKAQVTSRLAAVGEMAAGIAHEINNPLTGVIGFSQILLENKNVPEDIKEDLTMIADGSQRVADIVKRLLTFARQSKPVKTLANINELIENTLKLREYVLKTNNIEVITKLDKELPWSVVDPGQLQQVFLNLIVNAEQAMKKAHGKGTLTIQTEKVNHNIIIYFKDDGPGVPKDNLGRVFEPFFTTKAPGEGTGLGLSLSRSIILEHDGKMSVESEYGRGATFTIELPILAALPTETAAGKSRILENPSAAKHGRVMVVDDEEGVRVLLEKILSGMGHQVETFADAGLAKDKIDSGAVYDVIITDVRMPGMSGIELYSRIVEQNPALKNRMIFVTGDVMGLDIKAFLSQNRLPYLAKPFSVEALKLQVTSILETGHQII